MQAAFKVSSVLNCFENQKNNRTDITIVLPNHLKEMSSFFTKDLKLPANLLILDKIPSLKCYNKVKEIVRNNIALMRITNQTDFYFTDFNDTEIGLYLPYLKKCKPIQILSIVDISDGIFYQQECHSKSISCRIKAFLLSKMYDTHFIAVCDGGTEMIYTNVRKYNCLKMDCSNTGIIDKYRITLKIPPKSILFLLSSYPSNIFRDVDYEKLLKDSFFFFQARGYKVFVKGHPRLGLPSFLSSLSFETIPAYIPLEYLNCRGFEFAVGIHSAAIASVSLQIPAYSLLYMCECLNDEVLHRLIDYLNNIGHNIIYPHSLDEIVLPDGLRGENDIR